MKVIILLILALVFISCGKSNEDLAADATAAPQRSLNNLWTKQDGSRYVDLTGIVFNSEAQYMYFDLYGPIIYDEILYDNYKYTCYYNSYWDGDEYGGTVTLTYFAGEEFCGDVISYLYNITGEQLSFYNTSSGLTSYYY